MASQELNFKWKSLKVENSAANAYHNRFSEFKQKFEHWLKWHIKLANTDKNAVVDDNSPLVNGKDVEKVAGLSLDVIQSVANFII